MSERKKQDGESAWPTPEFTPEERKPLLATEQVRHSAYFTLNPWW